MLRDIVRLTWSTMWWWSGITLSARIFISGHTSNILRCWLMSAQPIGVFSTTAPEALCVSLPNNACRELATIVTCTIQGLRHVPGCNHVKVSFWGALEFSLVIANEICHQVTRQKWRDKTAITWFDCKDSHYLAHNSIKPTNNSDTSRLFCTDYICKTPIGESKDNSSFSQPTKQFPIFFYPLVN